MGLDFPPKFGDCSIGDRFNVVARLQCWDTTHDCHVFTSTHENVNFLATGLLDGSGDLNSMVNVEFRQQFPIPAVRVDNSSHVLKHGRPSWDSLHDVVELCAGFGGMTQGLLTSGFRTVAAVDFNEKFLDPSAVHRDGTTTKGT